MFFNVNIKFIFVFCNKEETNVFDFEISICKNNPKMKINYVFRYYTHCLKKTGIRYFLTIFFRLLLMLHNYIPDRVSACQKQNGS